MGSTLISQYFYSESSKSDSLKSMTTKRVAVWFVDNDYSKSEIMMIYFDKWKPKPQNGLSPFVLASLYDLSAYPIGTVSHPTDFMNVYHSVSNSFFDRHSGHLSLAPVDDG